MMKKLLVLVAVLHATLTASIGDLSCPNSCECQTEDNYLVATCTSYEFLKNPQQTSKIVRLILNNASLVNIETKLWTLKNMQHLDLSNNRIDKFPTQFPYLPKLKTLNLSANHLSHVDYVELPQSLEILDLSNNLIINFSKDWLKLKHLRVLNIVANPIDCGCDNLSIFEQLLANGVRFSDSPVCSTPQEQNQRPLELANCSIASGNFLNVMLGDEGSGEKETSLDRENVEHLDDDQLIISHRDESFTPFVTEENVEEGSGDEGSGDIPILPIPSVENILPVLPLACQFNCSTPKPVGSEDGTDASAPPNTRDGFNMIFQDVFDSDKEPDQQNHNKARTENKEEVEVETSDKKVEADTDESINMVEQPNVHETETVQTNVTGLGEMERASLGNSNVNSTYVIIGLVVTFVVFSVIYIVNKKRFRKRSYATRQNDNGFGDEMKPLKNQGDKSVTPIRLEKSLTLEMPTIVEKAPLLNGQNGRAHEERPNGTVSVDDVDDDIGDPSDLQNDLQDDSDVVLRGGERSGLLTAQPERVTIRASEIADSIPKTPQLIHRLKNTDGEFITTPVSN